MITDRWLEPADPGLQPERTLLAWKRTLLALLLLSAAAGRFALHTGHAPAVLVVPVLVGAVTLGCHLLALRRCRDMAERIRSATAVVHDGVLPAGVSAAAAVTGAAVLLLHLFPTL